MSFENLPGQFPLLQDGNLQFSDVSTSPIIMILGTAEQGVSETPFEVGRPSDAKTTFGTTGTLIRGMFEVQNAGGVNMKLYRMGATSAILSGIGNGGGQPGYTIETITKDDSASTDYKFTYEDAIGRLRVFDATTSGVVYDNTPMIPTSGIDTGYVSVTGTVVSGVSAHGDLGNPATAAVGSTTFAAADAESGVVHTAGTDGLSMSRMEYWEALHKAYLTLESEDIDIVVPMNVYLDDYNWADLTTAEKTRRGIASITTYPTASSDADVLGKVFAQEYLGVWYYWWDMDDDGIAEIYPSAGSATATTDAFGVRLLGASFHEVNFAWQLANFCFTSSENNAKMNGVIGVLPPNSFHPREVSTWIGRLPTLVTNANDVSVVDNGGNGTGLLGNKFLSGRIADVGTGIIAYTIDGVAGRADGGFIGTDDGYMDGTELKDRNDALVDIGKYLSVVGAYPILANQSRTGSYVATGAPGYAGFYSTLQASSAPTNKLMPAVQLPFRIAVSKLDDLAGQRYVMYQAKTKGIVVADAPTAARPDSDYQRLTTFHIVKETIDVVRQVGDPYIGEANTAIRRQALQTAIETALGRLQQQGSLQRYDVLVDATAQQQVQGNADIFLTLVPAFELRQITIILSLAAQ